MVWKLEVPVWLPRLLASLHLLVLPPRPESQWLSYSGSIKLISSSTSTCGDRVNLDTRIAMRRRIFWFGFGWLPLLPSYSLLVSLRSSALLLVSIYLTLS